MKRLNYYHLMTLTDSKTSSVTNQSFFIVRAWIVFKRIWAHELHISEEFLHSLVLMRVNFTHHCRKIHWMLNNFVVVGKFFRINWIYKQLIESIFPLKTYRQTLWNVYLLRALWRSSARKFAMCASCSLLSVQQDLFPLASGFSQAFLLQCNTRVWGYAGLRLRRSLEGWGSFLWFWRRSRRSQARKEVLLWRYYRHFW